MIFIYALRKELLEVVRTSKLIIMLAVMVAFGLASPLFARYTPEILSLIPETAILAEIIPEPTLMDAVSQFMENTYQFGFILGILLTMGSFVKEKDQGTASMILVKPVSRSTFILAKFLALAISFLVCISIASLGAYYYSTVLFALPEPAAWFHMTGVLWLLILVYVALTLAFSTILSSQAAGAGLSFGMMLVFSLIGFFPSLEQYSPTYLMTWAGNQFVNSTLRSGNAISGWKCEAWPALLISLGIIFVSLAVSCIVIENQEF